MRTIHYTGVMVINTLVRKENEKKAKKILAKGRGAWGKFVNEALEQIK